MSILDRPILTPSGEGAHILRRVLWLTLMLGLVVAAVLLPVVQSSDETTQGQKISVLEQQQSDLEAKIYAAQADVAQLGSLARVDSEARGRLGMVPAGQAVAVNLDVPVPAFRPLPLRYGPPPPTAQPPAPRESLWDRLLDHLPIP